MDPRHRLTDDEWDALAAGPPAAAAAMLATSRPGFVGVVKESLAGGKATTDIPQSTAAELVEALAAHLREHEELAKSYLDAGDEGDRESRRSAGLDGVDRAGLATKKLSPDEADAYAEWVLGVARAMAEAAPDQGESTAVSADEEHTIAEIERRLRRG